MTKPLDPTKQLLLDAIERHCTYCEQSVDCPFKDIRKQTDKTEKVEWINNLSIIDSTSNIRHIRMCKIREFIDKHYTKCEVSGAWRLNI